MKVTPKHLSSCHSGKDLTLTGPKHFTRMQNNGAPDTSVALGLRVLKH